MKSHENTFSWEHMRKQLQRRNKRSWRRREPQAGSSPSVCRPRTVEGTGQNRAGHCFFPWSLWLRTGWTARPCTQAGSTVRFFTSHLWMLRHLLPESLLASLVTQTVKKLPAIQETQVWSLGQENSLEKEMTTHSSTLAWRIPWTGYRRHTTHRVAKSWTWLSN